MAVTRTSHGDAATSWRPSRRPSTRNPSAKPSFRRAQESHRLRGLPGSEQCGRGPRWQHRWRLRHVARPLALSSGGSFAGNAGGDMYGCMRWRSGDGSDKGYHGGHLEARRVPP